MTNIKNILPILLVSIFLVLTASAGKKDNRITLRNGRLARKERVEKVWNSLNELYKENILEYFWLWRTTRICQDLGKDECELNKLFQEADKYYLNPLKNKTIVFLESNSVIHNGILDKETQNIISSSYCGTLDPKIVRIQYPISTIQKIKTILWPF